MTHAFFKALLFLGAGSVIHGMHEEQNIQKYGGLKKYMPATRMTFLIGAIAISGIPPLAGFFSKDEILWNAYAHGGFGFWLIGIITAMFTAFYMFRLYILTFEGKSRFDEHHIHPHESPKIMTIPLLVLAFLSIVGGFVGLPKVFAGEHGNAFENWLEPVFRQAHFQLMSYNEQSGFLEILLMVVSVVGASAAIFLAYYMYAKKTSLPNKVSAKSHAVYKVLFNKYYIDEIYDTAIVQPIYKISDKFLWKFTDVKIIDGFINGTASLIEKASSVFKKMQTGFVQFYAVIMVAGIAIALLWLMRLM